MGEDIHIENAPVTGPAAIDLLQSADALCRSLRESVAADDWLDAYLSACGLWQMVEDQLHPDRLQLRRIASYLTESRTSPPTRMAGRVAASVAIAVDVTGPGRLRRLTRAQRALATLTVRLAARLLAPANGVDDPLLVAALVGEIEPVAGVLGDDVLRLPACFRDIDQSPDDLRRLAAKLLAEVEAPSDQLLYVVGVRTSGCYLAPLLVAALRAQGRSGAQVASYRPGRPWRRGERNALRDCARAGGRMLLIDDPPVSGRSLAASARALAAAGVDEDRIVLVVATGAGADEIPESLQHWPVVQLPWREWAVHELLTPRSVQAAVAALAGPEWRVGLPIAHPESIAPDRDHLCARYSVPFTDTDGERSETRELMVEGAGQGLWGRHAVLVGERLAAEVPRVYGFADGLLYREWIPAGPQADSALVANHIAEYVAQRQQRLSTPRDPSGVLRGRGPIWEVAAYLLSGEFGALGPIARLLLLEPMTRMLLTVERPCIVDGATERRHWVSDPIVPQALRKVAFHRSAFGNRQLACYDAVFDLAGASVDAPDGAFARALRSSFESRTGRDVDGERWLLYRLVHLWQLGRTGKADAAELDRRCAAVVHDYLAECLLPHPQPTTGPICALDLDGVLETGPLGFPTTSPIGVLTLRALLAHGYRPVIATGRSIDDARDRCRIFGLAGAVAEYGSVIYDAATNRETDLLTDTERRLLDRIRAKLRADPHIEVVDGYRHSIRARAAGGPLPPEMINALSTFAPSDLRFVTGEGQTDIVIARVDKATGLTALTQRIPAAEHRMTVGDSAEDLPLLRSAQLSFAPRNADTRIRAARTTRTHRAYQAGLAEACRHLLGHRPGHCAVCRPPGLPPRTRVLLTVLALREDGLRGLPIRTAHLVAQLGRWSRVARKVTPSYGVK
ncbi:HAD hydrolase family protein [Nocardia sp. NPDC088792]|uniref:HAD hydrolase family protein n=1 Tax=Nocardia sp. NPDC088792 TaxID=3364332 RepID=UPI0038151F5D